MFEANCVTIEKFCRVVEFLNFQPQCSCRDETAIMRTMTSLIGLLCRFVRARWLLELPLKPKFNLKALMFRVICARI